MKARNKNRRILRVIGAAAAAALILFIFFSALSSLSRGQGEEGRQQLETALRRAAVSCYAGEGFYPPDLEYITENYGIRINSDRYLVSYEVFASNLMPEISVIDKKG